MILSLESNRHIAGVHNNLDVFPAVHLMQVDLGHDAERGDNLVGDVLHQPFAVGDAHNFMIVVHTDIDSAALRIGETAYPFEVFVAPRLLILDVLLFFGCYLCHLAYLIVYHMEWYVGISKQPLTLPSLFL